MLQARREEEAGISRGPSEVEPGEQADPPRDPEGTGEDAFTAGSRVGSRGSRASRMHGPACSGAPVQSRSADHPEPSAVQ